MWFCICILLLFTVSWLFQWYILIYQIYMPELLFFQLSSLILTKKKNLLLNIHYNVPNLFIIIPKHMNWQVVTIPCLSNCWCCMSSSHSWLLFTMHFTYLYKENNYFVTIIFIIFNNVKYISYDILLFVICFFKKLLSLSKHLFVNEGNDQEHYKQVGQVHLLIWNLICLNYYCWHYM